MSAALLSVAFAIGAVAGVSLTIGWVLARGGRLGPASAEELQITVRPELRIDWQLIHAALAGAGMTAVYLDGPRERAQRH